MDVDDTENDTSLSSPETVDKYKTAANIANHVRAISHRERGDFTSLTVQVGPRSSGERMQTWCSYS
jgi:hypothetical protein